MQSNITPILVTPVQRKRRNEVPPKFTPWHSCRIAMANRGLDSEMKAKRVLLRWLGLIQEDEPVADAVLAKYYALF